MTVNLLKREIGSLIGDENDVFDFIKPNEKESRTLRADLIYVFFFFWPFGTEMNIRFLFEIKTKTQKIVFFFFRHNDFKFMFFVFLFFFFFCVCVLSFVFCYFHFRRFAHVRSIDFRWLAVMTSFRKKKTRQELQCVCRKK